MKKNSSISPFFIEMILVILFFSISSVALLRLFAATHATAANSQNLTKAIFLAENQAENLKGSKNTNDLISLFPAALITSESNSTILTQYYDHNGYSCKKNSAFFCMKTILKPKKEPCGHMLYSTVYIYVKSSKKPLYTLSSSTYISDLGRKEKRGT